MLSLKVCQFRSYANGKSKSSSKEESILTRSGQQRLSFSTSDEIRLEQWASVKVPNSKNNDKQDKFLTTNSYQRDMELIYYENSDKNLSSDNPFCYSHYVRERRSGSMFRAPMAACGGTAWEDITNENSLTTMKVHSNDENPIKATSIRDPLNHFRMAGSSSTAVAKKLPLTAQRPIFLDTLYVQGIDTLIKRSRNGEARINLEALQKQTDDFKNGPGIICIEAREGWIYASFKRALMSQSKNLRDSKKWKELVDDPSKFSKHVLKNEDLPGDWMRYAPIDGRMELSESDVTNLLEPFFHSKGYLTVDRVVGEGIDESTESDETSKESTSKSKESGYDEPSLLGGRKAISTFWRTHCNIDRTIQMSEYGMDGDYSTKTPNPVSRREDKMRRSRFARVSFVNLGYWNRKRRDGIDVAM